MSEPIAPPPPGGGEPPGNPWEQRQQLGFLNAFIENTKLFVTNPGEAFARTKRQGDFVSPLIYAIIIGWIMIVISQIWSLIFGSAMVPMMPEEIRQQMGGYMAASGGQALLWIIFYPIYGTIFLFIGSGILHLCVMLVGGTEHSQAGFEGTFRTVAYASVANLAQIIPILGGLLSLVWLVFLGVVGLSTLHRTTQGKALMAMLIPFILCCVCAIAGGLLLGGMIAGLASQS